MLKRPDIEARVPHAGAMCLLESVRAWDRTRIDCLAQAPTADHPLAAAHGVPAIAGVEYAAQAAAVHGALVDGLARPRPGLLAKIAGVELSGPRLDRNAGRLEVHAELLAGAAGGCLYSFSVSDAGGCVVRGRLMVAFRS